MSVRGMGLLFIGLWAACGGCCVLLVVAEMKPTAQFTPQPPSHMDSFLSALVLNLFTEIPCRQYRSLWCKTHAPYFTTSRSDSVPRFSPDKVKYFGLLCPQPQWEFGPSVFTCHFRLFARVCGKRPGLLMLLPGTAAPCQVVIWALWKALSCKAHTLPGSLAQVGNVILSYRNCKQPRRAEGSLGGVDQGLTRNSQQRSEHPGRLIPSWCFRGSCNFRRPF